MNADGVVARIGAFGVPILQRLGPAASHDAIARGAPPYPAMRAWTNQESRIAFEVDRRR